MHDAELVPIIMFLVIGVVISLYFFFRSKDRQLIIEKGLSSEEIQKMFRYKWNPYLWLKVGIVTVCGSLGLLIGNYLMWAFPLRERDFDGGYTYTDANGVMMAFSIIFTIGAGFILAFYLSRKIEREEEERQNRLK